MGGGLGLCLGEGMWKGPCWSGNMVGKGVVLGVHE